MAVNQFSEDTSPIEDAVMPKFGEHVSPSSTEIVKAGRSLSPQMPRFGDHISESSEEENLLDLDSPSGESKETLEENLLDDNFDDKPLTPKRPYILSLFFTERQLTVCNKRAEQRAYVFAFSIVLCFF